MKGCDLQNIVDQQFSSINLRNCVSLGETLKFVGSGAYGIIYEGTLDQTKVAVKILCCDDKSAIKVSLLVICVSHLIVLLQKVLNEVYVWSKLEHENIIKLLGITTSFSQTVSIVIPLMSRRDAFDYVRQNPKVDPLPLVCCILILHFLPIAISFTRFLESPMD